MSLAVQAGTTKFRVAEMQNGRLVDGFILSFHLPADATPELVAERLTEKLSARGLTLEDLRQSSAGWQAIARQ
jgi:hypothetical protein